MRFFWLVIYPIFAAPILMIISAISMIFYPKAAYPPKHWAAEEERRIMTARGDH